MGTDLNGDGSPDIMIGNPCRQPDGLLDVGELYIANGPTPEGNFAIREDADSLIIGELEHDQFTESPAPPVVEDLDGDGHGDILLASRFAGGGGPVDGPGILYIWLGPLPAGVSMAADATARIENVEGAFAVIGDIDGDSGLELAVGDTDADDIDFWTPFGFVGGRVGAVHVLHAPYTGTMAAEDVATQKIGGPTPGGFFGYSIDAADTDGDGLMELLVGEYGGVGRDRRLGAGRVLIYDVQPDW